MQPFLQNLASEAARAVSFFISSTQYNKVDHVLLAGGVAATDGLAALIAEKTGIHTLVANPFQGMSLVNKIKASQLETDAPALMIACGLALRGVEA